MTPDRVDKALTLAGTLAPMRQTSFFVYILASQSRRLYVGVTSDLGRRMFEHRSGQGSAFTSRYRITRLVHFEVTPNSRAAIAREKQIKGWTREKRLRLVESANPMWIDLAEDWFRAPGG